MSLARLIYPPPGIRVCALHCRDAKCSPGQERASGRAVGASGASIGRPSGRSAECFLPCRSAVHSTACGGRRRRRWPLVTGSWYSVSTPGSACSRHSMDPPYPPVRCRVVAWGGGQDWLLLAGAPAGAGMKGVVGGWRCPRLEGLPGWAMPRQYPGSSRGGDLLGDTPGS